MRKGYKVFFGVFLLWMWMACNNASEPVIDFYTAHQMPASNGESVTYTISLSSENELVKFIVLPSIQNNNHPVNFEYQFNPNTRTANLTYIYTVPKDLKNTSTISLKFKVYDKFSFTETTTVIPIYQLPEHVNQVLKIDENEDLATVYVRTLLAERRLNHEVYVH